MAQGRPRHRRPGRLSYPRDALEHGAPARPHLLNAAALPAGVDRRDLPEPGARRPARAPLLVLAASLLLTVAATAFVAMSVTARDRARFETVVQATHDRLESRLETYVAMLEATAGLFAASDSVGEGEFSRYVRHLDLQRRYPGIQGIGFSRRVGAESHAIVYLEPLDARNLAAIGYDMSSEPVRRAAMDAARDEARPWGSGRVTLRQEIDERKQMGFLIYVPVFRGGPPASVAERRDRLAGFVYAPFRVNDLFDGVFRDQAPPARLRVLDTTEPVAGPPLHDSARDARGSTGARRVTRSLAVAGRQWTVEYFPAAPFDGWSAWLLVLAIAAVGLALSTAMFLLTRAQAAAQVAAERSEAARGRFYAAMSHELRTPLNAIIGYNHLLLDGVYGPLQESQASSLARGQQAARHLLSLVNDVLDLSKIEAGRIVVEPEPVSLATLVDDVATTMRPTAYARGCALSVVDDGCPPVVHTDARRVRQIMLNLLSNATKFGQGRPVTVRCAGSATSAVVEVTDQGAGIAPEDQARIFEEFVQLPGIPRDLPGTGLGLAISRALADLLGGTLTVESTLGVGSTFRLVLPASRPVRNE
jgi:signal transduction histidine kinase